MCEERNTNSNHLAPPDDNCDASSIMVATQEPPPRKLEVTLRLDGNVGLEAHNLDMGTAAGKLLCVDLLTVAIKLILNFKSAQIVAPPVGAAMQDLRSQGGVVLGKT